MKKNRIFRPYDLDQQYLLPPDMKEWLPADHLVYMVLDVVETLDLSVILNGYEGSHKGRRPYDPRMMVALLLYGYAVGVRSSRKLEQATYDQLSFRILTADQHPDHDTIADFRSRNLDFLDDLFLQSIRLCMKAGLVKLGHISIDGSKVKANASKHKSMSYSHMEREEQRLKEDIASMIEEAKTIDIEEDAKYGKGKRADELPEELKNREQRLKKIREAKKALEKEAEEKAKAKKKERVLSDQKLVEEGKKPRDKKKISVKPESKAQRNFTDPDSRIMKNGANKAFEYSYNAQIAVDDKDQVIVAAAVSQVGNDYAELIPLVKQIKENVGDNPRKASADTGYYSEENMSFLEEEGIDAYVSVKRESHGVAPPMAPKGRTPHGFSKKQLMARKLRTKKGKETYARRKAIVEPVFGQIKECRGMRAFLLRGHKKVSAEWSLCAAVHNLLKLVKSQAAPEQSVAWA